MTPGDPVLIPPSAVVLRPKDDGPVPTVIMMHGCGGRQPFMFHYAEAFRDAGFAAVVVDSFAHRGIDRLNAHLTVCTGLRLRGRERAEDLFAVIDWLSEQDWCKTDRIAAAGWSHGGWTIMDAMSLASSRSELLARAARLRQVLVVYPYCGPPSLTRSHGWGPLRPQVTAVLGGRDAVVGTGAPSRAMERLMRDGVPVNLHTFDDATHAFDDDHATDPRTRFRADLRDRTTSIAVAALTSALTDPKP